MEDLVKTTLSNDVKTVDCSSKRSGHSEDHTSDGDPKKFQNHIAVPLNTQNSLEKVEENQLPLNEQSALNPSKIKMEQNEAKNENGPSLSEMHLHPKQSVLVNDVGTSEQHGSLFQSPTHEKPEEETTPVASTQNNITEKLIENRDEESLVAAQSMTTLANGSSVEILQQPEKQSPSTCRLNQLHNSFPIENEANKNEVGTPYNKHKLDIKYKDTSQEPNLCNTVQQNIVEPSLPPLHPGNVWNHGIPLQSSHSNGYWNNHSQNYSCNQASILPPASSILKVPQAYDDNMNIQHGPNSYHAARPGPMSVFPDSLGQAIQTASVPTSHYENHQIPMADPDLSYHNQMMNQEYYMMPDNHGSAILPSGPGSAPHIFNSFPPGDPHFSAAANIDIHESDQYHASADVKYHRRARLSKGKSAQDYMEIVKHFVYNPRDDYIITPHDLYDKPDDKDTFYMAISPEVNPAEVRSIDHKGLVAKYIDYLLIENEHITEMSKSVSIPIENCVMDDPYLMDIVRVKIPFPTPKYLQWLSSYYPTIQVDWPAIRKELAGYNGVGGRKQRTYFVDRRPCHILLGESFYFFQREKDKSEK